MTRQELIITGGLLLDYMALLTGKYKEAVNKAEQDHLKNKIQTIKKLQKL